MTKAFRILLVIWVILRGFLLYTSWTGDSDPERKLQVLKYFSQDDIDKGREYSRNGFFSKIIYGYSVMFILLWLVLSGYASSIWTKVLDMTSGGFWLSSAIFLLLFFIFMQAISFPFQYYLSHVCESGMGFSNMSAFAWLARYFKSVAVSCVFQVTGTIFLLWLIKYFDRFWPLVLPVGSILFSIMTIIVFPVLVTPLFYTQRPLEDGSLKTKILKIADNAGISVEDVYQIDESRYSKHTNAYFTGIMGRKRIVLYDTLIKNHTEDEASLIFAHEAGHWIHDHMRIGLTVGFFGALAASIMIWLLFPHIQSAGAFRLNALWSAGNVPFYLVAFTVANLLFAPIEAQISQHFERQADAAALELTGFVQTFVDAKIRLAKDNRSELLPHPFRVFWLYSHPPIIARILSAENFREDREKNSR